MQKLFRRKNKKGYTLAEMLAVIGIIAIICAIAIPTFISLHRNLVFKRNNDYAKTVFMAAQANLVNMKSTGELKNLSIDGTEDAKPISADPTENALFPEEDYSEDYVYTVSGDRSFDTILPTGKIDSVVRDGNILIEYNPKSGNVFSVFYNDKGEGLTYDNVTRGEDARKRIGLGYYQGSGLSYDEAIEAEEIYAAQIIYHDGEEGIVEVILPVPASYQSDYNSFVHGLSINLAITGQTSGKYISLPMDLNSAKDVNYDTGTHTLSCTYVLDSLHGGLSYASRVTGEKNISQIKQESLKDKLQPGENITIAAEVNFEAPTGMPDVEINDIDGILVNPLFGALTGEDAGYIISLKNGRHLQNLNALAPQIAKLVSEVNITNDIYWSTTQSYYNAKYGENTDFSEAPARALPYFVPINNENLLGSAVFMYPAEEDIPEEHYNFIQRVIKAIVDFFKTIENFIKTIIGRAPADGVVPMLTDETDIDFKTVTALPHAIVNAGEGGNGTARVYDLYIDATKYDLGKDYYAGNDAANIDRFTGLFGYVNTSIDGVYVVNPIVKGYYFVGNNNPCTGALVGAAGFNTCMTNCGVYIDTSASTYMASRLTQDDYNKNGSMNWYGVSGEGAVGGLIGYAKSHRTVSGSAIAKDEAYLAFTNCFAAVNVSGNMRGSQGSGDVRYGYTNGIGGFVGNSQLTNFRDCYASGTVRSHKGYVYRNGDEGSSFFLDGKRCYGSGGFVGTSHGTQYYNCFASGNVISNTTSYPSDSSYESVGGFVGVLAYNETHSYGYEDEKTTEARQNSLFTNCYSLGTVNDGDSSGGGWIKSIYTRFCGETTTIYQYEQQQIPKGVSYYEMLYKNGTKGYLYKDCYYLDNTFYTNAINNADDECAEPLGYEDLAAIIENTQDEDWIKEKARISLDCQNERDIRWSTIWLNNKGKITPEYQKAYPSSQWGEASVTHPYTTSGDYEFPMIKGMPYYGDWPTIPSKIGLVYYEKYEDGTLGIYSEGKVISTAENEYVTALDNTKKVVEDGYAAISHASFYYSDSPTVKINGKSYNTTRRTTSGLNLTLRNQYAVRIGLYEYEVFPIVGFDYNNTSDSAFTNGFYTRAEITHKVSTRSIFSLQPKTYYSYFNPNFANTTVNAAGNYAEAVCPEGIPGQIIIRTARQFTNIGKANKYWSSDYNYVQTRDIDATYDAELNRNGVPIKYSVPACNKIGSEAIPFMGTYTASGEHNGRAFLNGFQNKTDAFFGVIGDGASVKGLDITLTPGSGNFQADGGYTGVFANRIEGTADNIAVTVNGNITTTATNAAGAFAGQISGAKSRITNCSVTANNITATGAQYVGGFAGYFEGTDASKAINNMNVTVGNITGKTAANENYCTGGFAGLLKNIDITNSSVTTGSITGGGNVGGFAGKLEKVNAADTFANVTGSDIRGELNVGGFAGYMKDSSANFGNDEINISANISAAPASTGNTAGGIVGILNNSGIKNVTLNLNGNVSAANYAGGAIGYADGTDTLSSINVNSNGNNISAKYAAGFIAVNRGNPIQGSGVVFTNATVAGTDMAGGFACTTLAGISGSSASGTAAVTSSNGDAAGFAVNMGAYSTTRANATNCYVSPVTRNLNDTAAMKEAYKNHNIDDFSVYGKNNAAGFAVNQYGTVDSCYALGKIEANNTAAGFICVSNTGSSIESCMSNTKIDGGYSFIAKNNGTARNCYALHKQGTAADTFADGETGRYFACYFADNFTGDTRKAKVLVYTNNNDGGKIANDMTLSDFKLSDLINGTNTAWEQKENEPSYPFDPEIYTAYPYPVPISLGAHYGDWCVPPIYSYGIAYYEEVKTLIGSELYLKTKDLSNTKKNIYTGALTIDNIDEVDDTKDIISSGYLVYCHGSMPLKLTAADAPTTELIDTKAVITAAKIIADDQTERVITDDKIAAFSKEFNEDYDFYKIVPATDQTFCINIEQKHDGTGSDKTAKILPHFARAIHETNDTVTEYEIRTEDQLKSLALAIDGNVNSFAGQTKTFNQTHNVKVTGTMNGITQFNNLNTYKGNDHRIVFADGASLNSALFGRIKGALVENVIVENAVLNAVYAKENTEDGSSGIIAASVQPAVDTDKSTPELIKNCKVVSPTINITNQSDKKLYAGNIAGTLLNAKISGCEVTDPNYTVGASDNKQNISVGGLIGKNGDMVSDSIATSVIDHCKINNTKELLIERTTEFNASAATDIKLAYGNLVGENEGVVNLETGTEEENGIKINLNYTEPAELRKDGAENIYLGGIAGQMYCGSVTGEKGYEVGGKFTTGEKGSTINRVYVVGGAIGGDFSSAAVETKYSNIKANVEISKNFAKGIESTDGIQATTDLGHVGKFAGTVTGGKFTECAGVGNSDASYQFLGTIARSTVDATPYWVNPAKFDGTTTLDKKDDNTYLVTDGTPMTKATTADKIYQYSATLENCTYSEGSKQFKQFIQDGLSYYNLAKAYSAHDYYTIDPAKSLNNKTKYIIVSSDNKALLTTTYKNTNNNLAAAAFNIKNTDLFDNPNNLWTIDGDRMSTTGMHNSETLWVFLSSANVDVHNYTTGLNQYDLKFPKVSDGVFQIYHQYETGIFTTKIHYSYLDFSGIDYIGRKQDSARNVYIYERTDHLKDVADFTYGICSRNCTHEEIK